VKKLIALGISLILIVALMISATPALAGTGNGAPSGAHYNLNIIGVPNAKNANFDGGNGARIFVLRTGPTQFYVHGGDSYAILDHDGTDRTVGTSISDPGIILPYDASLSPTWRVDIWVRLVGPKGSAVNWSSYYTDDAGVTWVLYNTFTLDKSSKFTLRTNDLLKDGYQDMLWQLDPVTKFRICQMRIYLK
jgi:hypothetical protein